MEIATFGDRSPIEIKNSGKVYGTYLGIFALSDTSTKIVNTGDISAGSFFAIGVYGAPATIYNAGHITGFVVLDADATFINQKGGVFETKLTSYFAGGNDLFRNEQGGTVLAATDPSVKETSFFVGLERFENKGLISLQDGAVGDVFRISNCYCSQARVRRLRQVTAGRRRLPRGSRQIELRPLHHRRRTCRARPSSR